MTIRLIIERKDGPGSEARVFEKDAVLVGREVAAAGGEDAWILPYADVSRRQCRFSRVDGALYVEGLSERNGTFVNGRRIEGTTLLRAGDRVRFGNASILVAGEPFHYGIEV
ncbi:MAG TPA: FHA domain-containing protein, partial [Nannocystaceae bacterium]|nr:FHA domain-containing protein [Nannocystaceae bacterium]